MNAHGHHLSQGHGADPFLDPAMAVRWDAWDDLLGPATGDFEDAMLDAAARLPANLVGGVQVNAAYVLSGMA